MLVCQGITNVKTNCLPLVFALLFRVFLQVFLCGNSAEAKRAAADVATKLGLTVLDKGSLSAAREIEDFPLRLFPEWRLPLCVAVGLTAFFFFYLLIRDVIYAYVEQEKDISYRIMISLANKVKTPEPHTPTHFFRDPFNAKT